MPKISPIEDFDRTLSAIEGGLPKLRYLAQLRHDGVQHQHWGMEHLYGAEKSKQVMELAHTALLQHVLKTPIRALTADAEEWLKDDPIAASKYLGSWKNYLDSSVTTNARAGAKKHLESVLLAISLILKKRLQAEKSS
jgi:hypothetical protein